MKISALRANTSEAAFVVWYDAHGEWKTEISYDLLLGVWDALYEAGYKPERIAELLDTVVGVMHKEYSE